MFPLHLFGHPSQVIVGGFGAAVVLGTAVLSLPIATESGQRSDVVDALFTATSAVCLTGLATVDTGGFWSPFGQAVILVLIQTGGLGIATLATLLTTRIVGGVGLRGRLVAQAETKSTALAELGQLLRKIVVFSLVGEALVAVVLTARFMITYDDPLPRAVYSGVFHAISAFNNAGFSLHGDSLVRYVGDPVVTVTVAVAVIVGGLGFPVLFELVRRWRQPRLWSVLTRITVGLTTALLIAGTLVFTVVEFHNARTFGALSGGEKWLAGFFHSAMTRSGGLNSVDVGAMRPESIFTTIVLMFIGGGSAGTAGGIKVTTVGLLAFVAWSEMRGEPRVNVGGRRIPESTQRQALAIALLGIGGVAVSTFLMLVLTSHPLDQALFEAVSAFSINGLSTGITADLPAAGALLLVLLMFLGRVGPLTVASALALRERTRRFELPEEGMIVG